MMYCAECGYLMSVKCCNGFGYWYDKPPLPQDFIKLRTHGKWYLYINANCPRGVKFVVPR